MEYCKVLLRDWKTLMTDNDLDLNDLIPKIASLHCQQKITLPKQKWQERQDCFFQRKKEKNALRSKKKWFRWHFSPLLKTEIRGGKGRMKRGKRGISWYIFVKILVKRAKTGIERKGICTVLAVQSMVLCRSTAQNYPIDYHNLTNKHHPFPNNFQKPDPVIIGHGHFRSFSFSGGANLPYKYYINIFIYTIDPNDRIIFENDRKWPWPKMTAFPTSKNDFKGSFCYQMHKPKTLIPLHISHLRTIFQHSTGKSLLSA